MDKAMEMGRASATGSFHLFVGKIVSTVILAVGAIIIGWFILESEYGLYAVSLIPATTILLFQDWGVGSALIRKCAKYRASNNTGALRGIIVASLTFEIATGLVLTVFSLLIANFIASTIFSKPETAFLITLASFSILSAAITTVAQSVFIGFERLSLSSATLICQAVVYGTLAPLLVYMGYGAFGAVVGYTLSIVITSIISVALLFFVIFKNLGHATTSKSDLFRPLKGLLQYGIPLAIATILEGVLIQFYSFIMAATVDNAMIGNYRIATNFAVLLTFLTVPIATALFPAFSKLDPKNEPQLLKAVFTSSVKYTVVLLVPSTLALMVLSNSLIGTIYGNKWLYAAPFLTLYVISSLFTIFGNLSVKSFLTAVGETKMLMKLNILTLFIGVPLAFLLIPSMGIIGLILCIIVAGLPSMFISVYWTWKRYGTKVDFASSAKIFFASAIATIATYLLLGVFSAVYWIRFTLGATVFLTLYLIVAPLIGAINQTDVNNLRAMFSGLGIISKILEIPLTIIQKILNVRIISKNKFSPAT